MKNLEIKARTQSHEDLKHQLKKLGAQYIETLLQIDTYYPCKEGRLKIREINGEIAELIAYQRPNVASSKISSYTIQQIPISGLKTEKKKLQNQLGVMVVVEKNRELWKYKNTRIHLDNVAGLGKFLELETVANAISDQQMKVEHKKVADFLHLKNYATCSLSYSDLLLQKRRASRQASPSPALAL
jgi:adenylate cyclase, class 2